MYDLDRTIDATVEPVTVDQAKLHSRIEVDDDDALLAIYITAARQYCEEVTGRALLQQTWRLGLERFPQYGWHHNRPSLPGGLPHWRTPDIYLPRPKLIGIASVTYLDLSGNRQTLDPSQYVVDLDGEPARISPALGCFWPPTLWYRAAIQVTYNAGYGSDPSTVPAALKLAILQLVAHWYENREATVLPDSGTGVVSVPLSVAELLQAYTLDAFTLESTDACW